MQPPVAPDIAEAARLTRNLGSFDVCGGNRVELLDDYHGSLERLRQDIDAAQSTVHLLYYIFADDETGRRRPTRSSGPPGAASPAGCCWTAWVRARRCADSHPAFAQPAWKSYRCCPCACCGPAARAWTCAITARSR